MDCEICENEATEFDRDLDMAMCLSCFASFNGEIIEIELNEVW